VAVVPGAPDPPAAGDALAATLASTGNHRPALRRSVASVDDGVGRTETFAVQLVGRAGRPLGVLEVGSRTGSDLTQQDQDLLVQLAQITTVAIENLLFGEEREVNRLKDEFLATVSHELRTPLNAMLSWAWMLRRGGLDAERTAKAVEAIERNGRAQARIVDDLLDLSRVVSGKLKLSSHVVSLTSIVQSVADSALAGARAKGLELAATVAHDAGSVMGDPERLQQVLWNLVSNAIKFTPRGGRVQLELAGTDDEVELRVVDTGQGIAPEFLPHIFEPFRQADASAGRRAGGLGLGLTIVRHLVELHGGRVEAHSDGAGRGATFVVSLPRAESYPAAVTPVAQSGDGIPAAGPGMLRGLHLLLVEDDPDTREAVGLILAEAGAAVTAVGSAREALVALTTERPDCLVCDIGLPGEDGYALVGRVRALDAEAGGATPAIALTAYAYETDRVRALAAGFQAHIAKPIEPSRLVQVVMDTIQGAGSARVGARTATGNTHPAGATALAASEGAR
jgi:signal transduction histidine kinase/FixJ family two-component response regulator